MPDIWIDVDTAVTVPVNVLPLTDNTDFKSIEISIAYDAAGMDLVWHFVTCAGVITATAVTPTTGGNYDWAEDVADKGTYKIEIPASGGASINNDTEGVGWFTGSCTGVLPWRGPTIGFRRAALNDLFIEGGTASTNLEDMFDGTGYAGGAIKLGVNLIQILGTTLTETAGLLAGGFKKFFNVATPTGTVNSLPDAVAGATNGLVIAGSNAATTFASLTVTNALTTGSITNNGVLTQTGAVTLSSTLTTGAVTLASLSVTGQFDAGNVLVDTTTVLTGAVTLSSTLQTGAVTLNALTVTNALAVGGTSTMTGLVTFTAGLASNITGNLSGSVGLVTGGATAAAIAALNNLSAAQVNAEVVDALRVDTLTLPAQATPSATPTIAEAQAFVYAMTVWKHQETATEFSLWNGATKIVEAAVSDDGTTFTRAALTTGA